MPGIDRDAASMMAGLFLGDDSPELPATSPKVLDTEETDGDDDQDVPDVR